MTELAKSIRAFWKWFLEHQSELENITDPESELWNSALDALQRVGPELWFVMSHPDGGPREFIVTAEGHEPSFPIVEALIEGAPPSPRWKFVALKPPMGFDFSIRYEGTLFDPGDMWFLPLQSEAQPGELGLRIGIPNLAAVSKSVAESAVATILDTALGERASASFVCYLEVTELPEAPSLEGYCELPTLAGYIEGLHSRVDA